MRYHLTITRRAQQELGNLPSDVYERVRDAIFSLADNPRPRGCARLHGREGWRIRVGRYRVIYEIEDEQGMVTVLRVGPRRDVYR